MGFSNGYDSGYDDGFADGVKSVQSGSSSGGRQPSPGSSSSGGPSGPQQAAAPAVPTIEAVLMKFSSMSGTDSDGFAAFTQGDDMRGSFIVASPNGEYSKGALLGRNLGLESDPVAKVELISGTATVELPSDCWKVVNGCMISLKLGSWWAEYSPQLYDQSEATWNKTATGLEVEGDFDEIVGSIRVTLTRGGSCTATGFHIATLEP